MEKEERKEMFIYLLNALKRQNEKDFKFSEAMAKFDGLGYGFHYNNSIAGVAIIKAANVMLDKEYQDEDLIIWFAYEINFGKTGEYSIENDKVEYSIMSAEDLWYFMSREFDKLESRVFDDVL